MKRNLAHFSLAASLLWIGTACGADPEAEFRAALPDGDVLSVGFPGAKESKAQGLVATSASGLVGGPADYYTMSYYQARELNRFGRHILRVIEATTYLPPSQLGPDSAVWDELSRPGEPNEFRLSVDRVTNNSVFYRWLVEGKHKSADESAYIRIAGGHYEPALGRNGRGWFAIDLDAIKTMNPGETGTGLIAYAFSRYVGRVNVLARIDFVDAAGQSTELGYAFGLEGDGSGFIAFGAPVNIDQDPARAQREDLILLTRWLPSGHGRSDVVAKDGDLGAQVAHGTQCWGDLFVSSYESIRIDGTVLFEDGDAASCGIADATQPTEEELPTAQEMQSPNGEVL